MPERIANQSYRLQLSHVLRSFESRYIWAEVYCEFTGPKGPPSYVSETDRYINWASIRYCLSEPSRENVRLGNAVDLADKTDEALNVGPHGGEHVSAHSLLNFFAWDLP